MPESLYNSVDEFVAGVLRTADPSVTVVIAIPSHTRPDKAGKTKEVKDQDQRADAALELLAQLFGGSSGAQRDILPSAAATGLMSLVRSSSTSR